MADREKLILCPYCGNTQKADKPDRCEHCGGYFEPLSRRATQISMGPWYIRDERLPFRPGCSYEVLEQQIRQGKVKPHSIVRGPTTRQFWSVARNVPGVAHLLGYCHRCGAHVEPTDKSCPSCSEPFMAVRERSDQGLLYKSSREVDAAKRALEREIEGRSDSPISSTGQAASVGAGDDQGSSSGDLLDEVLGIKTIPATTGNGDQPESKPKEKSGKVIIGGYGGPSNKPANEPAPSKPTGGDSGDGSAILNFQESGGTGNEPTPGPKPSPRALDFTPSQDVDAPYSTTTQSGSNVITWVLVGLLVVAMGVLGLLIYNMMSAS